jgi:hypothetical protein
MMQSDAVSKTFKVIFIPTDTMEDLWRHNHIKLPWKLQIRYSHWMFSEVWILLLKVSICLLCLAEQIMKESFGILCLMFWSTNYQLYEGRGCPYLGKLNSSCVKENFNIKVVYVEHSVDTVAQGLIYSSFPLQVIIPPVFHTHSYH